MAPAQGELIQVSDLVYVARTDLVNWILIDGADGVVMIDAGFPGQRREVLASIGELGYHAADVTAILLTHAHVDHFGTAIWFAAQHRTPVYCHAAEVGHAKRDYLQQASPAALALHAWSPRWVKWSWDIVGVGALIRAGIPSAQSFTEDVGAMLPGQPIAIPTPGHTSGHCSYLVDDVLVSGDALVTGHPTSSRYGPQLLHSVFNHDEAGCRRSLAALALLETEVLIPGHGDIWHGPIRELIRKVPN